MATRGSIGRWWGKAGDLQWGPSVLLGLVTQQRSSSQEKKEERRAAARGKLAVGLSGNYRRPDPAASSPCPVRAGCDFLNCSCASRFAFFYFRQRRRKNLTGLARSPIPPELPTFCSILAQRPPESPLTKALISQQIASCYWLGEACPSLSAAQLPRISREGPRVTAIGWRTRVGKHSSVAEAPTTTRA